MILALAISNDTLLGIVLLILLIILLLKLLGRL